MAASAERDRALELAHNVLDRVNADPDDDLAVLARQLLRTSESATRGWREATIAWSVCASIHRGYAEGRDPFYGTRQADFVRHENVSRAVFHSCRPGGDGG